LFVGNHQTTYINPLLNSKTCPVLPIIIGNPPSYLPLLQSYQLQGGSGHIVKAGGFCY
jgi:hypothetical protein